VKKWWNLKECVQRQCNIKYSRSYLSLRNISRSQQLWVEEKKKLFDLWSYKEKSNCTLFPNTFIYIKEVVEEKKSTKFWLMNGLTVKLLFEGHRFFYWMYWPKQAIDLAKKPLWLTKRGFWKIVCQRQSRNSKSSCGIYFKIEENDWRSLFRSEKISFFPEKFLSE